VISGKAASITGNIIVMAATGHHDQAIRVDFDTVPECTAVKLDILKTFSNDNNLVLTELSILTGTVFSQVAAPGACLATEIDDIGKVFGNTPHTIQVRLTFPNSEPTSRQWILNLGQHDSGAHHWIWNSNTAIQFGRFNGRQIQEVDITECTYLTTTSSGSVLKLYCDGVFLAEQNTNFSIDSPQLSLGVVPSEFLRNGEADFAGCITEVAIHSYEKSAVEVAQQNPPAFWKSCRWQSTRDQHLSDTRDLTGWTCADNEILTGFGINEYKKVSKIQCCELGGHSSVIPDTCTYEHAPCNAHDHMVFSGAYDARIAAGHHYKESLVGKCCEVKCDAPWCHDQDWGVNTDKCHTISADPYNYHHAQDLVCPEGTLMTQVQDGHSGAAHGIQKIESVVCCELDLISQPSQAPTTSPTTTSPSPSPTTPPSASPTKAPSTSAPSTAAPTKTPSTSPTTTSPSPSPTTPPSLSPTKTPSTSAPSSAPTSTSDCLRELFHYGSPLSDEEILQATYECLPDCKTLFKFRLRGKSGVEQVTIRAKPDFVQTVTLSKDWTDFLSPSETFTVYFRDGDNQNVEFGADFDSQITSSSWQEWQCGTQNENSRCESVRRGQFHWKSIYTITLNEKCDFQCYLANHGDLVRAFGATGVAKAEQHWKTNGMREGRSCTCRY
jgi:hypothetical protein